MSVCCSANPRENPACRDNPDCCINAVVIALPRETLKRALRVLGEVKTKAFLARADRHERAVLRTRELIEMCETDIAAVIRDLEAVCEPEPPAQPCRECGGRRWVSGLRRSHTKPCPACTAAEAGAE